MDDQKVLSFWQKPQVQGLLIRACGASGLIGSVVFKVCNHFGLPVPDVDTETLVISSGLTMAVEWIYGWYRDHPDNIAARLIKQINGDAVSTEKAQAVALAAVDSVERK